MNISMPAVTLHSITWHRRTGQHPFGGSNKVLPECRTQIVCHEEKNNNELLQCQFLDDRRVVGLPDERLICYPTRNISQVDGYLFRLMTQLGVIQNFIIFKRVCRVRWEGGQGLLYVLIMMHCTFIPRSPKETLKSTLLGGREGVTKKSTLCTLLIMLIIMDDPLVKQLFNIWVVFCPNNLMSYLPEFWGSTDPSDPPSRTPMLHGLPLTYLWMQP